MEFKTDALLLRATDYGENDKIVTLLTADRGKLTASVKGVKKAGAKLRFAAQPFCFAEYVLAERSGRHTVVSASLYDGFYSLREDVNVFYAASCVPEICDRLSYEDGESGRYLLAAVAALREIGENPSFALVKFLVTALALAGYPVEAGDCAACGKPLSGRLFFDFACGAFTCRECAVGVPASESTYQTLRAALTGTGESTADGEKRALRMLRAYLNAQADLDLPTLGEYAGMI